MDDIAVYQGMTPFGQCLLWFCLLRSVPRYRERLEEGVGHGCGLAAL